MLASNLKLTTPPTAMPNCHAQRIPSFIYFWCNIATEEHASLTLVKSTAEAPDLHPSCSRHRNFTKKQPFYHQNRAN
jgi:hypothetical protein